MTEPRFAATHDRDYYCVVGNPVEHSLSPVIHAAFAEQTGQVLSYDRVRVEADGFAAALRAFIAAGGRGMNVTVPFKEDASDAVNALSERAERAGAVNTIICERGGDGTVKTLGDNTDGVGLLRDLTVNRGVALDAAEVLVAGAGGAARGAIPALLEQGVKAVTIANRTEARAVQLAQRFADLGSVAGTGYQLLKGRRFDLLINATSLGLVGQAPPVPATCLGPATTCYDMMYGDEPTWFMRWAETLGAGRVFDGLGMLVEQAAEAFALWRGVRPETAPVISELRASLSAR